MILSRARRFALYGVLALLVGALCWSSCARQAAEARLEVDLFVVDKVALPQGLSAEDAIRTLLERGGAARAEATVTVDYPLEGSVFPPEIVAPTFLWHDSVDEVGLWLIEVGFETTPYHVYVLTRGLRAEPEIDWRAVTEENTYEEPPYQASAKAWTPDSDV